MNNRPKLSIIVPTCNRPDTLQACLRTLTMQGSDKVEIIVSDNAGDPRTAEVVNAVQDPRIVSLRTDQRLGMSEHWEFALARAKGEWIAVIGDDDGLLPGSVDRFLKLADTSGVEAISARRCYYTWPAAYDGRNGKLTVFGNGGEEIRNSAVWLEKVVKNGWTYKDLPGIYTGDFVKKDVLERVRQITGRYLSSIIPDIYSSVAIASVVPEYYYSQVPFAVSGASSHSTGQKYFRAKRGEKKNLDFFNDNRMTFHKKLGDGLVPSKTFLVYESFLQSTSLRNDEFTTDLEEQICLALACAEKNHREGLMDYFAEVAEINGLDFGRILQASRGYSFRYRVKSRMRKIFGTRGKLHRGFREIVSSPELADVHQASLAAAEIMERRKATA